MPRVAGSVIIMCFAPIDTQRRSRLAIPLAGSGRWGWRGGGWKAARAVVRSERTLALGGVEGRGEQPAAVAILKPALGAGSCGASSSGTPRIFLARVAGAVLTAAAGRRRLFRGPGFLEQTELSASPQRGAAGAERGLSVQTGWDWPCHGRS